MREQITWEETRGDSVNGFGIKIHYLYTSFDKDEIEELKEWCMEHLNGGLVIEGDADEILQSANTKR